LLAQLTPADDGDARDHGSRSTRTADDDDDHDAAAKVRCLHVYYIAHRILFVSRHS
jgi:hypothetical protein